MSSAIWGERRIPSVSTVANQSYRFWHAQPEGLHNFQNAGEAGTLVLGRLIALHLLRFDPKAARQARLSHSRRYARADQGFRQIRNSFKNYVFTPARVEPLVGFNLLS